MYLKIQEVDQQPLSTQPGVYFVKATGNIVVIPNNISGGSETIQTLYLYGGGQKEVHKATVDVDAMVEKARLEGELKALREVNQPEIVNIDASSRPEEQLSMSNVLKLIAVSQSPTLAFGNEKKK